MGCVLARALGKETVTSENAILIKPNLRLRGGVSILERHVPCTSCCVLEVAHG